jgi:hypothetical protein
MRLSVQPQAPQVALDAFAAPALSGQRLRSWWIAPFKLSHEQDHMLPGVMAVLRVLVSGHVLLRFM